MLQANDILCLYFVFGCGSFLLWEPGGACPRVDIWELLEKGVTMTAPLSREMCSGEVSLWFYELHRPLSLGPRGLFNASPINNLNRWEGNRQGFLVQVIIQYEICTTVTHLESLRFPSDGSVDFNYLCMTDVKWEYSYCHTLHDWLQCPQRVRKLQLTF